MCVHPVAHFPLRNGFAISRKYSFRSAFPNDSVILSKFGQKRKIYYSVAGNKTLGHRSFWAPEWILFGREAECAPQETDAQLGYIVAKDSKSLHFTFYFENWTLFFNFKQSESFKRIRILKLYFCFKNWTLIFQFHINCKLTNYIVNFYINDSSYRNFNRDPEVY